ncbi:MAG: hypothetical protein J6V71_03050, partial [Clostridia bacterium]|nr:hypothetical protein [Clostridia bacterium]
YNQELIKKGALDKETELIIKKNAEIISIVNSFIPYENYNIFQELLDNYEKLINKYSKYAYLLGFTRAVYEKD